MSNSPLPAPYRHWRESARGLLEPLMRLAEPEGSEIPLVGPPSDHDANADRLEAFARPCLLAALWLQSVPDKDDATEAALRERTAVWFRKALLRGTDPTSDHYWGPNTNYHQNGVEIGLLVIALKVAAAQLWEPLDGGERARVLRWIASNRGTGHHWNNHLFFGVLCLEFLIENGAGRPADALCIERWFVEMELMYRGRGWFMDGMNQAYDHYNAYAFHFYGLAWARLYGHTQPERAERWRTWAKAFLDNYQRVFSASGEHPAFGRSIPYRFNASTPFSLAVLNECSPLPLGRVRRLCTRNLDFFLSRPIFQEQGALSLGWHDVFPSAAERYSCAGSTYWAAKAFVTLLLPPDHPFWTEEEEPLATETGDGTEVLSEAGLTLRSFGGTSEILNAGTAISATNMEKFGPWKWGKLSYRSGVGFTLGTSPKRYSLDGGLTIEDPRTGIVHGRHFTTPLAQTAEHLACTYALGDKTAQANVLVETYLWWRKGWLLQVHYVDAFQPMTLRLGGFAVAAKEAAALSVSCADDRAVATAHEGLEARMQNLHGFERCAIEERLDESTPRTHIQAPFHLTPYYETRLEPGPRIVAALVWSGHDKDESAWWSITRATSGQWELVHPSLGKWTITHPLLPEIAQPTDLSS